MPQARKTTKAQEAEPVPTTEPTADEGANESVDVPADDPQPSEPADPGEVRAWEPEEPLRMEDVEEQERRRQGDDVEQEDDEETEGASA